MKHILLIATIALLVTACTEKKEEKKNIIITEQKSKTDEAVQIPMHGTNEDKSSQERK